MKKILLVGNLYALAKKLSSYGAKVFAAPGSEEMREFAECVDLREDDTTGLLKFAAENEIDLTVAVSEKAIKSDIVSVFQANEMPVFGPSEKSANFAISKAQGKRFLYKLHAPTPKFGIFEKPQLAFDYLKEANYPLVVRCDNNDISLDRLCCLNFETAKNFAEELFMRGEERVVTEEYAFGHEFTLYAVTDGYHALPLAVVHNFKFTESGDGGLLTSGVGAYVPDYRVPESIIEKLFKNVILNALNSLEKRGMPYSGILGVEAVMTDEDSYTCLEFKPFLQEFDAQAVLNSVDENLIELFEACANGSFADEYEDILTNDNCSVSCVVKSRTDGQVIPNLELAESAVSFQGAAKNKYFEYISAKGNNFVLTSCAKTFSRAKKMLAEDLELVKFDGMKYRKDIAESR